MVQLVVVRAPSSKHVKNPAVDQIAVVEWGRMFYFMDATWFNQILGYRSNWPITAHLQRGTYPTSVAPSSSFGFHTEVSGTDLPLACVTISQIL
ncbi:hypothetical protein V6N11_032493 [Hibiscus sabdariffa]|uniref:Uncharacterized protein n=1 Tax=Hibiscus sabdariffa TaxID=183260 RepID=A0ABR2T1F8_9ROSI